MVKRKTTFNFSLGFAKILWSAGVLLLAVGCSPISPSDQAFFEEWEQKRQMKAAQMRAAASAVSEKDVIQRVQEYPAAEGAGSMSDWLNRQFVQGRDQVLFPRWSTIRRGSNKQEVLFTYILIDAKNNVMRHSYVWDVDVLDMTVSPPRFQHLGDVDSPDRTLALQHQRRIREHEKQLE